MAEVSGNLTRIDLTVRFLLPYISATMRDEIHNFERKNQKMHTFLNCDLSNLQSNPPNFAIMKSTQTRKKRYVSETIIARNLKHKLKLTKFCVLE